MNRLLTMIENAENICILGHINPDGDCVGSCLGLYNYITGHYKDTPVKVYLETFSTDFNFINGADAVCHNPEDKAKYDLAISLDCGDMDRHGAFGHFFQEANKTINIDHHVSNAGFGDYSVVDLEASSTAEAVYKLLAPDTLSKACAEAFYVGIVHDTGVFKHSSTTKRTMEIAGALLSYGARSDFIIDYTFYKKTFRQNQLLGRALLNAELTLGGKVIVSLLTQKDFAEFGADKLDTDGIVDQLRVTEGVEAAVFVYENTPGVYKYSMRSCTDSINVSEIAVSLGGGGHVRAAGVEVAAPYEETIKKILGSIKEQLG